MNNQAAPIASTTITTQVIDSQGSFDVNQISWSGWTELTVTGLYFNEYENSDSSEALTLNAVTNKDRRFDTANINMFTHLAAARFKQRVTNGQSRNRAWRDSQSDVKNFFGLRRVSRNFSRGVEQLDILRGSGTYRQDNANLLLFTGAFLATDNSSESLQDLTEDFADDGQFNGVGVNTFNTIAIRAGEEGLLNNLSNNLRSNGASNPPNSGDMPVLPDWVNTDVEADTDAPVITITGQENVTIVVGTSYIDQGATAIDEVDGEVAATAVDNSDVIDTSSTGEFTVTYTASDIAGNTATAYRTVTVILGDDVTAPELTLLGDNPDTIEVDTSEVPAPYEDPGYDVTDDRDEVVNVDVIGLENVLTSVVGTYTINYTAEDTAGNSTGPLARTVIVEDNIPPVITLVGESTQNLTVGDAYEELGATVTDNYDTDVSYDVDLSGLNLTQAGEYKVTYSAQDSSGNNAVAVERIVIVNEVPNFAPTVDAGDDVSVRVNTPISLTGSAIDLDGDVVNIAWTNDSGVVLATTEAFDFTPTTPGDHVLTLSATDEDNATGSDQVTVSAELPPEYQIVFMAPTVPPMPLPIPYIEIPRNYDQSQFNQAMVLLSAVVDGDGQQIIEPNIIFDASTVILSTPGEYSLVFSYEDPFSRTVTNTLTVNVLNTTPLAISSAVPVVDENSTNNEITIQARDTDRGDTLMFTLSDPANGTVSGNGVVTVDANGSTRSTTVSYTPNADYVGTDSFNFTVSDGVAESTGTITISVEDKTAPVITLNGNNPEYIILEEGTIPTPYTDPGASATDIHDLAPACCEVTGTVDSGTIGTYTLTYYAADASGNISSITRTVYVVEMPSQEIPELSRAEIDAYLLAINTARSVGRECGMYGFLPAVPAVSWSDKLYRAAYEHSQDMTNTNTFEHEGSGTPFDWSGFALGRPSGLEDRVFNYGYEWTSISENIAAGASLDTAQEAIDGWLTSEGHCRNIMSDSVTEVGMAISVNPTADHVNYWTQNFGKPLNPPETMSNVNVRVTTPAGDVIEGVTILASSSIGNSSSLTTAQGTANIELLANQEYVLKLDRVGYATQVSPVLTPEIGEQISVDFTMIQRGEVQTFDADTGGEIVSADGASVTVAPGSFETAGGVSVTGPIQVTITPVDISKPSGLAAFPGEFTGIQEGGGETPIISYGTVEYKFTQAGQELQLKTGATADIIIPIYDTTYQDGSPIQATLFPQTIALWSLNEETGIWVQEGFGTVVESASSPTGLALSATVTHFTWWNCDVSMDAGTANVSVVGPPSLGTATIRAEASESCNIGWRSPNVNTVVNIGETTSGLFIPSMCEVCFSADISTSAGTLASTSTICRTVDAGGTVTIDLEIPDDGPLDIAANSSDGPISINAALGFASTRVQLATKTFESGVIYSVISGSLPSGLSLKVKSATEAEIVGIPTTTGNFSVQVQGINTPDGETDSVTINYSIVDPSNATLPIFVNDTISSYIDFDINGFNLNPYNVGGESTNWSFTSLATNGFVISPSGFVTYEGPNPWYDEWEGTVRATNAAGYAETSVSFCTGDCGIDTTPIPGDYALRVRSSSSGFENGPQAAVFEIQLNQVSPDDIVVNYSTSDYDSSNPATADVDYVSVSSSIVIPAGQTSVSVSVDIIDDSLMESYNEYFYFNISSPTARLEYSGAGQELGRIIDNDIPVVN